jgi:hypothetical protein
MHNKARRSIGVAADDDANITSASNTKTRDFADDTSSQM